MNKQFISLTEANSKYFELIERAEAGETIVITRYGKPVATILPFDPKRFPA